MMRRFEVQDPDGVYEVSEAEIASTYFLYWRERMTQIGKADEATFDNCLKDWITVHWAHEIGN